MPVLNIAFYKFTPLSGLSELRARLLPRCRELGLRGTILLAPEGINASLAGPAGEEEKLRAFVGELESDPAIGRLCLKESWSEGVPFVRMFVKIKKEIIPSAWPSGWSVSPAQGAGQRLAPRDLKRWIGEKRDFVLLDTRNRYEIEHGSFEGARDLGIAHFREFGDAFARQASLFREKALVMFCTGGIRCEKATRLALEQGCREVYQLDGGILRYFEECGGEHYRGSCFVFDERVAVRPK